MVRNLSVSLPFSGMTCMIQEWTVITILITTSGFLRGTAPYTGPYAPRALNRSPSGCYSMPYWLPVTVKWLESPVTRI